MDFHLTSATAFAEATFVRQVVAWKQATEAVNEIRDQYQVATQNCFPIFELRVKRIDSTGAGRIFVVRFRCQAVPPPREVFAT
mmetsp:Transcript_116314/g.335995  ORF Transcript_116314/g.335995 Transcript_116314/m.335995 type:complete len:83 (-) Transcript_116314:917-1165(-)